MFKIKKVYPLIALIALIIPITVFAEPTISFEGVIKGANSVICNAPGPKDSSDPLANLERDFVLTTTSGQHYFLTNVYKHTKKMCVNKNVRVVGKQIDNTICVDRLEVLKNNKYVLIWSRDAERGARNVAGYDIEAGYWQN